jgi:ketosteroid isomerase-like protein
MDMHPNARILHEAMQNPDDFQAFFDILADDVVWHEIGRDEPTRGKQALMERFQSEGAKWEISGDEHAVIADDEHAMQLLNVIATRDGQTFHYRTAEIYHMRDGKVTERWAFSDDTAAINAFFG